MQKYLIIMFLVQIGAMTKTPRLPTELETLGARRTTGGTCFSASVLVTAEVNGNAKGTHPCIQLALVSGTWCKLGSGAMNGMLEVARRWC